jgi:prophage antirepressor-like protein
MSELRPFVFDEALVRVRTDEQGNPWFVAKDVCSVLDLGNVTEALRPLDDDEKITLSNSEGNPRAGVPHQINMVSESGLYALVFRSRKPEARRFRKWVTSEVLPALRRTGRFAMSETQVQDLPPFELPEKARRLKPGLRERLLSDSLQAARLTGSGSLEEVQALFARFCLLVADRPAGRGQPSWLDALDAWADECLEDGGRLHTPGWELYSHFKRWLRRQSPETPPPGRKAFGSELGGRFRRCKSNSICYHVLLREGA